MINMFLTKDEEKMCDGEFGETIAVVDERFKRRCIVRFGRGDASDYRL